MTVQIYEVAAGGGIVRCGTGVSLDAVSLTQPEGIYTTMRTHDGRRIVGLSAHLRRMVDSFSLLEREHSIELSRVRQALHEVLAREPEPARLRMLIPFEGSRFWISIEPYQPPPAECYKNGVRCATSTLPRETPRAKYTAFIPISRSLIAKAEPGVFEIIRIGEDRRLLEGLTSNFFAIHNGRLRTAEEGVLEGVTRGIVLREAAEIIPVDLTPIAVDDLARISESFITSSGRDVVPVVRVDDQIIAGGEPGPVTRELMRRYRAYLSKAAEAPLES